jgi:outer membrane protein assembly factor BamB
MFRIPRTCWQPGVALAGLLLAGTLEVPAGSAQSSPAWPQWGGPSRNFVVDAAPLATSWPEGGPREVWRRPLGDGHSSIVMEAGRLYTMYRPPPTQAAAAEGRSAESGPGPLAEPAGPSAESAQRGRGRGGGGATWAAEETVIALDEATGETVWEHSYPARPLAFRFGAGPFATPLIVGDRLYTLGSNNQLFAFDKANGDVIWAHDLVEEFGAQETLVRPAVKAGMSCSPIAFGDMVIVTAGGPGQSVMAFDQATGEVRWRSGDFNVSQASPILIEVGGAPQLVVFGGMDVNGLDPATGELLWSHPHDTSGDMNISTPLWTDGNLLFVSSAYDGGSRMLRIGSQTTVEELWFTNQLRLHISNAIRIGDMVIGANGDFGPSFITALDVRTGERLWQDRSFARAHFLLVGETLVVLDEDGVLGLARASRDGFEVLARAGVLSNVAWTAPTLVGSSLYARDRREIVKLELPAR